MAMVLHTPRSLFAVMAALATALACAGAAAPAPNPTTTVLRCGAVWDGVTAGLLANRSVVVRDGRIRDIATHPSVPPGATVVDLANETCLPGLIDTHTHVFLQGDITAEDYDVQLLKQSPEYRTILATVNARRILGWGFTTVRDLETEGAGYADVDVRTAIERGVIAGPRMQVASRSMDVTGAYPLLGYAPALSMPKGVQEVDGADGGRRAVREQLSHGADWIKVYADRSYRVTADGVLDDIPTFTLDELRAIVDETHRQRHRVAAHAMALQGVHNAVTAGVDSIEHGGYISDADLATMVRQGTTYVPTLYVGDYVAEGRAAAGAPVWLQIRDIHADTFRRALKAGVRIAFGTDIGGFDWHTNPAIEFGLMVKYGMTPEQALRSATVVAADLLGLEHETGTLEVGKAADVIAVHGNPLTDVHVLESVRFVMKQGEVVPRAP